MYELFEKPLNQQCSYSWYDPGHNTLFFGYYYSGWWPIFHTLIKGHDSSEVISNIYISSVYYHGFCLHFSIPWKWELIKTKKKGQQWKAGKKVWSEDASNQVLVYISKLVLEMFSLGTNAGHFHVNVVLCSPDYFQPQAQHIFLQCLLRNLLHS